MGLVKSKHCFFLEVIQTLQVEDALESSIPPLKDGNKAFLEVVEWNCLSCLGFRVAARIVFKWFLILTHVEIGCPPPPTFRRKTIV